jgi:beta-galactosidase
MKISIRNCGQSFYILFVIGFSIMLISLTGNFTLIRADSYDDPSPGDQLCEIPDYTEGTKNPLISLNGLWKFCQETDQENWNADGLTWQSITVPGEPAMQGCPVKHDTWYAYQKVFALPGNCQDKNVIIRFNGVYSYAKIWVNGVFVREHHGGFTTWECNVTNFVKPTEKNTLILAFCDRRDEISYASGYAKHPIGGILRNVELIVLPRTYISGLDVETTFDQSFVNARLTVNLHLNGSIEKTQVSIDLTSPSGDKVKLDNYETGFQNGPSAVLDNIIFEPQKWDAEHPNIYHLSAKLIVDGKILSVVKKKIGFRQIDIMGDKLLINGSPVKLRGACRHDIHPLLGRSASDDYDLKDVLLAKEANFNFIRTSHYPPSRAFLQYCDQYGIYVEEETAVCFVSAWRSEEYLPFCHSENDTAFTSRYLGQLAEMIERDRNHPSVIIWSIGNENKYGSNFKKEFDYVKTTDPSRPVMFSYPGFGGYDKIYDILSDHYPSFDGSSEPYGFKIVNFSYPGIPVLHDEWAHVSCYNKVTLSRDPNIRDFWGESIDRMWSNCYESEGGLGGAIWGMIDETFMLPDTCAGYGQWGIVDTWRRPKPEFWNVKKAYSPVRLSDIKMNETKPGKDVSIEASNRFDHTNLNELKILCNGRIAPSPDIRPRQKGVLVIPGNFVGGERNLDISFYKGVALIDRYNFKPSPDMAVQDNESKEVTPVQVQESENEITVSGETFEIHFSRQNGLISSAYCRGEKIIESGPFMTFVSQESNSPQTGVGLTVETAGEWVLQDFHWQKNGDQFTVSTNGSSGDLVVEFTMTVKANGEILLHYKAENSLKSACEAGIYFLLAGNLDKLSWERNAYWNFYPDGHLGRPRGISYKLSDHGEEEQYRKQPFGTWENGTKDFYLFQQSGKRPGWLPVPNEFRATKLNIFNYSLTDMKTNAGLMISSDGRQSCRSEVNGAGSIKLLILDHISYNDLDWGNYEGSAQVENPFESQVKLYLMP